MKVLCVNICEMLILLEKEKTNGYLGFKETRFEKEWV